MNIKKILNSPFWAGAFFLGFVALGLLDPQATLVERVRTYLDDLHYLLFLGFAAPLVLSLSRERDFRQNTAIYIYLLILVVGLWMIGMFAAHFAVVSEFSPIAGILERLAGLTLFKYVVLYSILVGIVIMLEHSLLGKIDSLGKTDNE